MSDSFVPKWFKDLGKTCSDLFKDEKYNLKQTLEVNTSTSDPQAKITSKFVSDGGSVSAKFTEKLKVGMYAIDDAEITLDTAKSPTVELKNKSLTEGLELSAKFDPNPNFTGALKWRRAPIAATVEAESSKGDINVNASLVLGFEGLSVGGAARYEPSNEKDQFADYNCAFEYEKDDLVCTVKTEDKTDVVKALFTQRVNDGTQVGIGFNYNYASGTKSATLGGAYTIDENASVKAKVVTGGILSGVYAHKLWPSATLQLSSSLDVRDIQKNTHRLGIKLVLGEA